MRIFVNCYRQMYFHCARYMRHVIYSYTYTHTSEYGLRNAEVKCTTTSTTTAAAEVAVAYCTLTRTTAAAAQLGRAYSAIFFCRQIEIYRLKKVRETESEFVHSSNSAVVAAIHRNSYTRSFTRGSAASHTALQFIYIRRRWRLDIPNPKPSPIASVTNCHSAGRKLATNTWVFTTLIMLTREPCASTPTAIVTKIRKGNARGQHHETTIRPLKYVADSFPKDEILYVSQYLEANKNHGRCAAYIIPRLIYIEDRRSYGPRAAAAVAGLRSGTILRAKINEYAIYGHLYIHVHNISCLDAQSGEQEVLYKKIEGFAPFHESCKFLCYNNETVDCDFQGIIFRPIVFFVVRSSALDEHSTLTLYWYQTRSRASTTRIHTYDRYNMKLGAKRVRVSLDAIESHIRK
ncbi:unnamed protein product [Trichogramma brassicae]|uniref:Uncharacterized protein n=1 Tax=Trichogramma brassicae TaxID=86971 RepID=A0A6H5I5L1_9HYME|nr:unnamed protein product [Trichogramma brassicae]